MPRLGIIVIHHNKLTFIPDSIVRRIGGRKPRVFHAIGIHENRFTQKEVNDWFYRDGISTLTEIISKKRGLYKTYDQDNIN